MLRKNFPGRVQARREGALQRLKDRLHRASKQKKTQMECEIAILSKRLGLKTG